MIDRALPEPGGGTPRHQPVPKAASEPGHPVHHERRSPMSAKPTNENPLRFLKKGTGPPQGLSNQEGAQDQRVRVGQGLPQPPKPSCALEMHHA